MDELMSDYDDHDLDKLFSSLIDALPSQLGTESVDPSAFMYRSAIPT